MRELEAAQEGEGTIDARFDESCGTIRLAESITELEMASQTAEDDEDMIFLLLELLPVDCESMVTKHRLRAIMC